LHQAILTASRQGESAAVLIMDVDGFKEVNDTHGLLGYSITSTDNSTLVAGTNSVWNNSGNVYAGYDGSGNSLVISNGGWVKDNQGFIGYNYYGSNNVAVVTGAGSVWSNSTAILIGNLCSSNSLALT
jgi:autotransporter family porin